MNFQYSRILKKCNNEHLTFTDVAITFYTNTNFVMICKFPQRLIEIDFFLFAFESVLYIQIVPQNECS